MSNLSLGPVIGTLGGGAEMHTIPVDFVSSSGIGMKHVADVPVPEGATARVVVVGTSEATNSTQNAIPYLMIDGVTVAYPLQAFAGERVVTGPTVVEVNQRNSLYVASFVGTVYWWEVTGNE